MSEIVIYNTVDSEISIEVQFENETVWLNQKQIALLFDTKVPAINKHIKNIFKDCELTIDSTISKMEIVQKEQKGMILQL